MTLVEWCERNLRDPHDPMQALALNADQRAYLETADPMERRDFGRRGGKTFSVLMAAAYYGQIPERVIVVCGSSRHLSTEHVKAFTAIAGHLVFAVEEKKFGAVAILTLHSGARIAFIAHTDVRHWRGSHWDSADDFLIDDIHGQPEFIHRTAPRHPLDDAEVLRDICDRYSGAWKALADL